MNVLRFRNFGDRAGTKGHRAVQRCVRSPWHRWSEPSAAATERSTERRSSGTHITTQYQSHDLGQWVQCSCIWAYLSSFLNRSVFTFSFLIFSQCVTNQARHMGIHSSLHMPDKVLNFVKDHFLMDSVIRSSPLLLKRSVRYTQIAVHKIQGMERAYDVLFIGTGSTHFTAETEHAFVWALLSLVASVISTL